MSNNKSGDKQIVIDVGAVMEQLAVLRRSIERLEALVNELSSMVEDLRKTREAIDRLTRTSSPEVLVPLSNRGAVFAKARITDTEKFIVHLGGDVYGEITPEEAMNMLLELEGETNTSLNKLASQLNKEIEQYQALQQILAEAQRRQTSSQG